jgi:hypothetical protein
MHNSGRGDFMMTEDDNTRQVRWLPAAVALMKGPTLQAAASSTGCSVRTLQRYLDDPGFREVQAEVAQSYVEAASQRLLCLSHQALDTLAAVIADASTPAAVRVRACLGLLDASLRYREVASLDRRLRRMEDFLNGTEPGNTPRSR